MSFNDLSISPDDVGYINPYGDPIISKILPTIKDKRLLDLYNYGLQKKVVNVGISEKCHLECQHCYAGYNKEKDNKISDEIFDIILNQLDKTWLFGLYGGEPYDWDDLSKKIKKIKDKGLKVKLSTSGHWANNDDYYKKIEDAGIDYIFLSCDYWHKDRIPVNYTLKIKDYFINTNILVFVCFLEDKDRGIESYIDYIHNTQKDNKFNYLKINNIDLTMWTNPLSLIGNSKDIDILKKRTCEETSKFTCRNKYFLIETNGDIHAGCDLHSESCFFGNIKDVNIEEVRQKIGHAKVEGHYQIQKICQMLRLKTGKTLDCCNPKWKQSGYYENYDNIMI